MGGCGEIGTPRGYWEPGREAAGGLSQGDARRGRALMGGRALGGRLRTPVAPAVPRPRRRPPGAAGLRGAVRCGAVAAPRGVGVRQGHGPGLSRDQPRGAERRTRHSHERRPGSRVPRASRVDVPLLCRAGKGRPWGPELGEGCPRGVPLSRSAPQHGAAKVLERTFEEWMRYRDECLRRMASEPYPAGTAGSGAASGHSVTPRGLRVCAPRVGQRGGLSCGHPTVGFSPSTQGLFCNRTFDMYACWPDGSPGTAVNVSCPFYLPWFEKGDAEPRPSHSWGCGAWG